MNSQLDINMLNIIRIVIWEELADIYTSVARIDKNVANQQQFIRQTFNADRTNVIEQSVIKRQMTYLVSHSDDRGERSAEPAQGNSVNYSISEEESIVVITQPWRPKRSRRT
ncbi:hypothetical protein J3Q64DRAFT_1704549 [Phycomyces blakesleeanus]|uniref:Uncharacterized protein n=2 Tax=Phycomyces blakesleeanus TaxID=4837 RepID=A0A167M464_PHYB8|nr:hypothetical protein PHYBLDRAFT_170400 [Phycomyces blakesleeanus NRRL 1555(-)]OAD71739.1 hypothetical protein PHYBLDRAFT_170400 [Phycomyces blakesleeanus NRRL 1555(-)]|eukprot:XP_018289779.1 hypothetical protein PHYBLDRAFT_170400 [Phycomyces blakesleeanus NRRL 1555(-)]